MITYNTYLSVVKAHVAHGHIAKPARAAGTDISVYLANIIIFFYAGKMTQCNQNMH